MLDEKAPVALYQQLKGLLIEKIRNNEWPVNSRIPTERELCDIYRISRITVRQALGALEKEGYLYRKQGKGTFVTSPKIEQRLSGMYSFSDDIRKMGLIPRTRMVFFRIGKAGEEFAKLLNVKPWDDIYSIKRLRLANDEPFALETSYIPYDLCPGMTEEMVAEKGLYNTMQSKSNIVPMEAEEVLEAVLIGKDDAAYLNEKRNSPGLYLERFTFDRNRRIIEYCRSIVRGDRYKYRMVLRKGGSDLRP
ncbi:MAG: GntR family transcriptional regulator [Bacillota bacterium]